MVKFSAIIITYNEERNIRRCLESLRGIADEIIVVDSYSQDKTREICESMGAKVVQHAFNGYADQKNRGIAMATHPYILSLDADEELSAELKASILRVKKDWTHDGYEMNRMTSYCGRWIRHGAWYPDRKLRLFDKRLGKWTGGKIHEKVSMDAAATIGRLKGDILHYSFYTVEEHVQTMNEYSTIKARVKYDKGIRPGLFRFCVHPVVRFLRDFLIKGGFRDGFYGYVIARNNAFNVYLTYVKVRELIRKERREE